MDKKNIEKKIKALLAKTEQNGATEAEAIAAAEKINELLEKYNMSMDEVDVRETNCHEKSYKVGRGKSHPVHHLAYSIGQLTNTKTMLRTRHNPKEKFVVFFGYPHDVECAHYLMEIIHNAMDRELKQFKKTDVWKYNKTHGKTKRQSFFIGMVIRLNERMDEMVEQRNRAREAEKVTGTDLIVLKNQIIDEEYAEQYGNLKKSYYRPKTRSGASIAAGMRAANNVNLNAGIESDGET